MVDRIFHQTEQRTPTCKRHGLVDEATRFAGAAVSADPRKVVRVLIRRGELQDLGGLLEHGVQCL